MGNGHPVYFIDFFSFVQLKALRRPSALGYC